MALTDSNGRRRPHTDRLSNRVAMRAEVQLACQRVVGALTSRPLLLTSVMLLCGVAIHTFGLYSDIAELYVRDALWLHRLPYIDYPLEYPVLLGWLMWLTSFAAVPFGLSSYFYASALLLCGLGLLLVHIGRQFEGVDWPLLAYSPALGLYVALNWDMAAVLPLVAALLAFRRGRAGWGGLLLSIATWLKFFPIIVAPLVLIDSIARRRWGDVWRFGVAYTAASIVINLPVALQRTGEGWRLRAEWLYFFRFHQDRPREVNIWNLFDGLWWSDSQVNLASALLLALGLGIVALLLWQSGMRVGESTIDLVLPATLAALAWWFFINKVYSPQYSLWLAVLLALVAAPRRLSVSFAIIDALYFIVSFTVHLSWNHYVLIPAMIVREAVILAIALWASRQVSIRSIRPSLQATKVPIQILS